MCGILGLVVKNSSVTKDISLFKKIVDRLFLLSESRGKEASGLIFKSPVMLKLEKSAIPASKLIKTKIYKEIFTSIVQVKQEPFAIIGHSRLVTNGTQFDNRNNQPVEYNEYVAVHNGIVVNADALWKKFPELKKTSDLDSEIIVALISKFTKEGQNFSEAVQHVYGLIEGAASIAVLEKNTQKIILATNTGSLYYCNETQKQCYLFASEQYILQEVCKELKLTADIEHIKPGTGILFDLVSDTYEMIRFQSNSRIDLEENPQIPRVGKVIADPSCHAKLPNLKRCTKCILPETMPFIRFNEQGICNYCEDYVPIKTKAKDELKDIFKLYRKNDGQPDCIIAFSGGRDSCYGLHLLKEEFEMTPLAITYDWGMVTDIARRNQARMCGKLGVEHVIVSANLAKKRDNIRKNIAAWLKKPNLGMIPLFMAGDKQFFYYTNQLREKAQIELSVLCANPLEYTYFKTGFAGISNDKHYRSSTLNNKIKLLSFYGKQFISNPAYLNSSLLDSLWAFLSFYFSPKAHSYIMLYDYIKWDEDECNQVLFDEYNWEVAKDTTTTWRIGDGTAAFYNYIYFHVVGFTENDTFRSNQVREGIISREQALTLVESENHARYDTLKEYLNLVGLDYNETMQVINQIPSLY